MPSYLIKDLHLLLLSPSSCEGWGSATAASTVWLTLPIKQLQLICRSPVYICACASLIVYGWLTHLSRVLQNLFLPFSNLSSPIRRFFVGFCSRFLPFRVDPLLSVLKVNTYVFFLPYLSPSHSFSFLSKLLAVEVIRFKANPAKLIRLQVAFTPVGKRSQHSQELDGLLDTENSTLTL